jgi:hypothetical protein
MLIRSCVDCIFNQQLSGINTGKINHTFTVLVLSAGVQYDTEHREKHYFDCTGSLNIGIPEMRFGR